MLVTNGGAALALTDVVEVLGVEGGLLKAPVEPGLIIRYIPARAGLQGQGVLPAVDLEKLIG